MMMIKLIVGVHVCDLI